MKPQDAGDFQIDQRNVWESNRMHYCGAPADSNGGHIIEMATDKNIWRFNTICYGQASGIAFDVSGAAQCRSNAIYNNTIFENGLGVTLGITNALQGFCGIVNLQSQNSNNFIVNNIIWANAPSNVWPTTPGSQVMRTNWDGDVAACTYPQFVNTNGYGDYFRTSSLPNLALQTNSPCIDAGTWLAYVTTASGSGTSMGVDNSLYFSDGNRIVTGDTIQLQGQTNTVTVSSNDWANNTLYLSGSLTWTNGQGVSLAYNGTAPDMGAFETQGQGGGSGGGETNAPATNGVVKILGVGTWGVGTY